MDEKEKLSAKASFFEPPMNKTEALYDRQLRDMFSAGLIKWWAYEPIKIRLANRTWYTPDFVVVDKSDRMEAVEVKAFWEGANRAGWTDDSRVKIKVASEVFPVRFRAAVLDKHGLWRFENFGDFGDPGTESLADDRKELLNLLNKYRTAVSRLNPAASTDTELLNVLAATSRGGGTDGNVHP